MTAPTGAAWSRIGALLVALALPGSALSSAPRPRKARVVLLSLEACCADAAWPAAERRLAAELRALNVDVRLIPSRATSEISRQRERRTWAVRLGAAAALSITRRPDRAEVWLYDRSTDKTLSRGIVSASSKRADRAGLIALRAIELYRASLLEYAPRRQGQDRPSPPARLLQPAGQSPRPPGSGRPPADGLFAVRVGSGVIGGPGGTGAHLTIHAGLRWHAVRQVALELAVDSTVLGPSVNYGPAKASFDVTSARFGAHWRIRPRGRVRPAVGLAIGLLYARTRGEPTPRYLATSDKRLLAAISLHAQLAVILFRHLWLRLDAWLAASLPELAIHFDGVPVARFGRPTLGASIAVETPFP